MTYSYGNQFSATTKQFMYRVDTGTIPADKIVGVFIKLSGAEVNFEPMLANLNAKVQTKAGNIWTIRIPAGNIKHISSPAISYVDVGSEVFSQSNKRNGRIGSEYKSLLSIAAVILVVFLIVRFS